MTNKNNNQKGIELLAVSFLCDIFSTYYSIALGATEKNPIYSILLEQSPFLFLAGRAIPFVLLGLYVFHSPQKAYLAYGASFVWFLISVLNVVSIYF